MKNHKLFALSQHFLSFIRVRFPCFGWFFSIFTVVDINFISLNKIYVTRCFTSRGWGGVIAIIASSCISGGGSRRRLYTLKMIRLYLFSPHLLFLTKGSPPSRRALSTVVSTEPVLCRSAWIAAIGMSGNMARTVSICICYSSDKKQYNFLFWFFNTIWGVTRCWGLRAVCLWLGRWCCWFDWFPPNHIFY